MSFPYKRVLLIGATAGIGAAFADRLIQEGAKVIAVGRRQDRLDAFVKRHGNDTASAVRFDIARRQDIDDFVRNIIQAYPDLDCLLLNAGVQHPVDLSQPAKVNLASFHSEVEINFSSFVDITVKFLPFLMEKAMKTSIIFTGSNLAIVPASTLSAYSASKAALNAFTLCLRDQLRDTTVKIIEISPPPVQTELHDYMGDEKGRQMGMPVGKFTDAAFEALLSGSDQIVIGSVGPAPIFQDIVDKRREAFENLSKMLRGQH